MTTERPVTDEQAREWVASAERILPVAKNGTHEWEFETIVALGADRAWSDAEIARLQAEVERLTETLAYAQGGQYVAVITENARLMADVARKDAALGLFLGTADTAMLEATGTFGDAIEGLRAALSQPEGAE